MLIQYCVLGVHFVSPSVKCSTPFGYVGVEWMLFDISEKLDKNVVSQASSETKYRATTKVSCKL